MDGLNIYGTRNSIMRKKVIYQKQVNVLMWNILGEYPAQVVTRIFKRKFLWFTFYRIKQYIPKIKNPCFDGEYSANTRAGLVAEGEYELARTWLIDNIRGRYE